MQQLGLLMGKSHWALAWQQDRHSLKAVEDYDALAQPRHYVLLTAMHMHTARQ